MLQFIRDQASGWIAWVIVILIIIPFALWGVHQFQGGGTTQAVANVNGTEISRSVFQQAYQSQRQQLQRIFGGQLPSLYNEDRLRKDTLEQMINDELILQASINTGMRIGDDQLLQSIQSLPTFNSDTGFSTEQYSIFLQSRGLTATGFEADMRRSVLSQQLIAGIRSSAIVTKSEIEKALVLSNEKRRFTRLDIAQSVENMAAVDEAKIRAYFDAKKSQFVIPERVKIAYIELSRQDIAKTIRVDDQALRKLYENNSRSYNTPEQRKVRHILIQVASDADEATVAAAKEKLLALSARIKKGESFTAVAKVNSDDPGSASKGGDLGFFGKGVMDPAFEKTAFSLPKNKLSEPVRSSFGWHLIEVTGVQKSQAKPFEKMRETLAQNYRNEQADQIFAEQIDQLATLAFEQSDTLQPAADALGLEVQHSDYFSSNGLKGNRLLSHAKVLQAAFSADLKNSGINSELLELGPNNVAVLRVIGQKASEPEKFADVRDEIIEKLKLQAAVKLATQRGKALLNELKNGKDRLQAADENQLKWSEEQAVTRRSQGLVPANVLKRLFKMSVPATDSVRYAGLEVPGTGYTVIALVAVEEAKPGEKGALDEKSIRQTLIGSTGEQAFSALVKSLREKSEIQTFMQNVTSSEGF